VLLEASPEFPIHFLKIYSDDARQTWIEHISVSPCESVMRTEGVAYASH
jgi:hypothetical protein